MANFVRLAGLMCAHWFASYILWMMMLYLVDVWKIEFTKAAAMINIWRGTASVLPFAFDYLVATFVGNFSILLLSSLSFSIGLGLLWMSTPPVLANLYGSCTEYKPECIGDPQKQLLYAALVLLAIGMAGYTSSFVTFSADQTSKAVNGLIKRANENRFTCCIVCAPLFGFFMMHFIPIMGYSIAAFVKSWAVMFGLTALVTLIAVLVFLSGVFSYEYVRPHGSAFTTIFRVFVAALSKMFSKLPQDESELFEKGNDNTLVPHTKGLRCLDKAAIILPQPALEQQEQDRWRLCRVTEVESTKTSIRLIPLYMTFIICGVVSAIGETHFLAQATTLDPKLGSVKVPLVFFLWIYNVSMTYFPGFVFTSLAKVVGNSTTINRYTSPIGVGVAMVFSVLSCIVAAIVEAKRLKTVTYHGSIDNPDESVPMTVFWLIPQFALLGTFSGIGASKFPHLVNAVAPHSMLRWFNLLRVSVVGVGCIGNVVIVFAVGRISNIVTGVNWFQSTLNKSRLDNYYWVLATLSATNLIVYGVVACFYRYKGPTILQMQVSEDGEAQVDIYNPVEIYFHGSSESKIELPITSSDPGRELPANYNCIVTM